MQHLLFQNACLHMSQPLTKVFNTHFPNNSKFISDFLGLIEVDAEGTAQTITDGLKDG